MKLITEYKAGKPVFETITWEGHSVNCDRCSKVDVDKPATFVHACAMGSRLLMDECVERQRPAVKEKQEKVRKWAEAAGVFKT